MLREIAGLGFSHVELSHGISVTLVPGILRALEEGVIKVSSTHNFCPLPAGFSRPAPNAYEPTADDATQRDQWLRQTRRSLEFAAQVGARVLVMHLGSVRFWWRSPADKLLRRADACYKKINNNAKARAGEEGRFADEPDFAALRKKVLKKIRARMTPYWERVRAGVEELRADAVERGVILGFENRERPDELPLDDQFGELLDGITQPNTVAYWHDTGHARLKEQLGISNHREQLEKNAARLAGFHLHDTTDDGHDHQPIGAGGIDFDMVSSFWKPHHVLVLELSPRVSVDDVVRSKNKIETLMRG